MQRIISTPAGDARLHWFRAGAPRAVLLLGHGAGGGIEAPDLQAIAAALPAAGVTVVLAEQPWRVAGKKLAPAPKTLDAGWPAQFEAAAEEGLPVYAGGRSAGARVACRTAAGLGAAGVLALAFPLHPPGRPEKSRAEELLETGLSTLVVQGGADTFGAPEEFPALPDTHRLVEVPYGSHAFKVPKKAPLDQGEALALITDAVAGWL
ncbi:alpha/beta hydrolase family protein [Kitasatospora sp. CB01950]|uniref:alpha/beta hydrolase family protein n=1 Tax=Kitasatospora sp. CB01950 TaxID=1703930 RepID=UPI0009391E84|nr:alpha/beta family hydrolase [Kitasatospora sp. CB01950]OKJ07556.1 hydrolase [Kitasatospora sp. CB01950]